MSSTTGALNPYWSAFTGASCTCVASLRMQEMKRLMPNALAMCTNSSTLDARAPGYANSRTIQ